MYTSDERFRQNIDRFGEGTAELMSQESPAMSAIKVTEVTSPHIHMRAAVTIPSKSPQDIFYPADLCYSG